MSARAYMPSDFLLWGSSVPFGCDYETREVPIWSLWDAPPLKRPEAKRGCQVGDMRWLHSNIVTSIQVAKGKAYVRVRLAQPWCQETLGWKEGDRLTFSSYTDMGATYESRLHAVGILTWAGNSGGYRLSKVCNNLVARFPPDYEQVYFKGKRLAHDFNVVSAEEMDAEEEAGAMPPGVAYTVSFVMWTQTDFDKGVFVEDYLASLKGQS
jgi:hypothetical protein